MRVVDLEGQLARIVVPRRDAVNEAIVDFKKPGVHRRRLVIVIRGRIEGSEEEQPILQAVQGNVAAQFKVALVVGLIQFSPIQVHDRKLRVVSIRILVLHASRVEIPANGAEELSAARLRHQLDDAAADVTVLWFKTARLDLNSLNDGTVNAYAERAVGTLPNSDHAERRAMHRYAVSDIKVFKARGACDGSFLLTSAEPRRHACIQLKPATTTP